MIFLYRVKYEDLSKEKNQAIVYDTELIFFNILISSYSITSVPTLSQKIQKIICSFFQQHKFIETAKIIMLSVFLLHNS